MAYVEWLRVRNTLRVCGILLAIGFVAIILVRIAVQIYLQQHPEQMHVNSAIFIDFAAFFPFSMLVGLIVATILGAPLAKENSGHLEIAWTKPVSRESLALRTFGIDIAGIVAAQLLTVIAELASIILLPISAWSLSIGGLVMIAVSLMGPIAWYALLTAATASLRQSFGVVLGLAWPVCLLIPVLALIQNPENPIVQGFHAVIVLLRALDPIAYMGMGSTRSTVASVELVAGGTPGTMNLEILIVLTIIYLAFAIIQWRRIEG